MEPPISPSTNMEAAFGRLHNSGMGAFGARPTVLESIIVNDEIDGSTYGKIYPTISVNNISETFAQNQTQSLLSEPEPQRASFKQEPWRKPRFSRLGLALREG